jgi:RNA recognition motif-containing protein
MFTSEALLSQKIYVGNLGFSISNEALSEKFAKYGTVSSAKVITDRETNRSKGFGFVEMSSVIEASKAINALNGTDFDGRQMNVSEAKPMEKRENNRY